MNKQQLFVFLRAQDASVLLSFLEAAFDEMGTDQREAAFGRVLRETKPLHVNGSSLLTQITEFERDSLALVASPRAQPGQCLHVSWAKTQRPLSAITSRAKSTK